MSKEKLKKYRWLIWTMIFSIVAMLFSPLILYHYKNRAIFDRKVKTLAADGFPVSLDDLEATYVLPPGVENAADVYLKAFSVFVEPNELERELLPVRGDYMSPDDEPPYPPEVLNVVKMSLDKNQQYLEMLDKASRIEHCLFPRTRRGNWFSADYLSELKKTAMMLIERNLYLAQTQQSDALFDSTQTCISLTKTLSMQPQLIDHLVTIAIQAMVAANIQNSLDMTSFSEEQLWTLQQQFHQMQQINTYAQGLITERAQMIEVAQLPPREILEYYGTSSVGDTALGILYLLSGLKEKDSVIILDIYEKQIKIAQLPFDEQLVKTEKLRKEIDSYPWFHYGIHMTVSTFRIAQINLRVMSQLQCTETALAIERYRFKYNSLPDSLDVLVPEFIDTVYLDPFDGKPLRYFLRDTGGYTIYSIGEDGIDNGGLNSRQMEKKAGTKSSREYDHPFTVKH